METKNNSNKKRKIIFNVSVLLFFAIIMGIAAYSDYKIKHDPVIYSIATITDFSRGGGVPPWFNYEFILNGKQYKSSYSIASKLSLQTNDSLRKYIGKRFFVKISKGTYKINRLLLNKPVPDSIKKAPPDGWDEIPE